MLRFRIEVYEDGEPDDIIVKTDDYDFKVAVEKINSYLNSNNNG